MTSSLNIGLVAHNIDPGKVFARVPNERGRWMMVGRCVVEVDCPWCGAVTGEPCRAVRRRGVPHDPIRYHVATHTERRMAWQHENGRRRPERHVQPHKMHITAAEVAELGRTPNDEGETP